ncbi:shikimate dehydrogenase [Brachybacterium huguangmaarense]|uniref:Shikimate dehydrogenase (NADP(+)) n=1 Tax=Brachybacterium huguangmaarense TaxID=1652028 RepID=A0ABY6FZN4_9MICO|nr:shikimate dehydrogenase [Brachybacterium huguangmaarense]UYG16417.1 shikimate dehydrogenase [Brachybacterium huguangmaarense]
MPDEIHERITGRTELIALIADPIRHSRSPRMHNLALAHLGIDAAYLAFEVDEDGLAAAVAGLAALGARGFNVSMPHEMSIVPLLDEISDAARLIGACNTVVRVGGRLRGENTDGVGYVAALRERGVEVAGATLTLLGAGGAATAIAVQCALDGARAIRLFNRRDRFFAHGEQIVATVREGTGTDITLHDLEDLPALRAAVAESHVLANATEVGMGALAHLSPLPDPAVLRPDLFVSDVVYAPERSLLLRHAEAAGCRVMNGLGMMFHQGAASFRLWTGQEMPLDVVRAHMDEEESR